MWFSARTFGTGEMVRHLTPLTSDEARRYAREYQPMKAYPEDYDGRTDTREPRIIPTEEQTMEYQVLRYRMSRWDQGLDGGIPVEMYRYVSRKVEDYRCNYDWRDRIIEDKRGRKGLESAFGELVLPTAFQEIPERYTSINGLIPYVPVVKDGRYALASTKDAETSDGTPATPYEYDDAFMLPFSNGRLYAVRSGAKWRILKPFIRNPYDGIMPLCGYIIDRIYPVIADRHGDTIVWPIEADCKFGLIMNNMFVMPEYDDFSMDYETGLIKLINAGDVAKAIDINEGLPF